MQPEIRFATEEIHLSPWDAEGCRGMPRAAAVRRHTRLFNQRAPYLYAVAHVAHAGRRAGGGACRLPRQRAPTAGPARPRPDASRTRARMAYTCRGMRGLRRHAVCTQAQLGRSDCRAGHAVAVGGAFSTQQAARVQILRCKSTVVETCQSTRVAITTFTDEADKLPKETLPEPLQFRLGRTTGEMIYLTTAPIALRRMN